MNSTFNVPVGLSMHKTNVVAEPVLGVDEALGVDVQNSISRYYMVTNNRLVTPADIKIFCYNELLRRYNIDSYIIRKIMVRNVIHTESQNHNHILKGILKLRQYNMSKYAL